MKSSIEIICAHQVEFRYFSRSKAAAPQDSDIEHVRLLLNQDCIEGELCTSATVGNRRHEFRGWWHIVKPAGQPSN